jgi:hypothetical protein
MITARAIPKPPLQPGGRLAPAQARNSIRDTQASAISVRRNHSFVSNDDGIDIDSSNTKLSRNEARYNADLGIEAVPGITDGGGNRAGGNGNPLQCAHISCR